MTAKHGLGRRKYEPHPGPTVGPPPALRRIKRTSGALCRQGGPSYARRPRSNSPRGMIRISIGLLVARHDHAGSLAPGNDVQSLPDEKRTGFNRGISTKLSCDPPPPPPPTCRRANRASSAALGVKVGDFIQINRGSVSQIAVPVLERNLARRSIEYRAHAVQRDRRSDVVSARCPGRDPRSKSMARSPARRSRSASRACCDVARTRGPTSAPVFKRTPRRFGITWSLQGSAMRSRKAFCARRRLS